MTKSYLINYVLLSLGFWLLAFIARLFFVEMPVIENIPNSDIDTTILNSTANSIIDLLFEDKYFDAFILVFKNNMKSCIINIAGGFTFGFVTIINLLINGFISADIMLSSHKFGLSVTSICRLTLPHSFELIGFFLSGAIGFFIASRLYYLIIGEKTITNIFFKHLFLYFLLVFLMISLASYVEIYVTIKQ